MKRYVGDQDQSQTALLPENLDEFSAADNVAGVVAIFIDVLDLKRPESAEPEATVRPAYQSVTLLKSCIYEYSNCIQSTRCLECETHRNPWRALDVCAPLPWPTRGVHVGRRPSSRSNRVPLRCPKSPGKTRSYRPGRIRG